MATPPPPDVQAIVPPLLACLPTSFASSRAPPALLPLLSPILRQRLDLHASPATGPASWLRLLCWDSSKAEELKEVIETSSFEPHPVSGELEVGDIERISYKRFDAETLKVQLPLLDWNLTVLLLWCMGEVHAWKVTELIPYDSELSRDQSWVASPSAANDLAPKHAISLAGPVSNAVKSNPARKVIEDDNDDDYWAQYDRTPNTGTPGARTRAHPVASESGPSDADYYARYSEVQPAMDNYDPDEHVQDSSPSINGSQYAPNLLSHRLHEQPEELASGKMNIADQEDDVHISHPVPSSPSSRAGSDAVARLESTANRYSASEVAIKQHISYTLKSMYRLSKGAGLSRQEFEDMIQRELETLSLLDRDDA